MMVWGLIVSVSKKRIGAERSERVSNAIILFILIFLPISFLSMRYRGNMARLAISIPIYLYAANEENPPSIVITVKYN